VQVFRIVVLVRFPALATLEEKKKASTLDLNSAVAVSQDIVLARRVQLSKLICTCKKSFVA